MTDDKDNVTHITANKNDQTTDSRMCSPRQALELSMEVIDGKNPDIKFAPDKALIMLINTEGGTAWHNVVMSANVSASDMLVLSNMLEQKALQVLGLIDPPASA